MSEFDLDFLGDDEEKKKKPRRRSDRDFDDAFSGVGRRDIRQATGTGKSITRGSYDQLTFRLPPEIIEEVFEMAKEVGVSKEEMKRWVVYRGVVAFREGERPETEEVQVRRRIVLPGELE